MIVRPYGVVVDGVLELGLELVVEAGQVRALRPHTGVPEPFIASLPFVNAHSHLEYRGLQGKVAGEDYWNWIRNLTRLKAEQDPTEVPADCMRAAQENRETGVAWIGEHADRIGSGAALSAAGIGGTIFQELITFFERDNPEVKREAVLRKASDQAVSFGGTVTVSAHSPYLVESRSLDWLAERGGALSIHVAESKAENALFRDGKGPIADFFVMHGARVPVCGLSAVGFLHQRGLLGPQTQLVHACDVDDDDLKLMAETSVSVAHCPRSNRALGCPGAPVRRMLETGLRVGLGLDSAASSGPIDMFDEMRSALQVAQDLGEAIRPEQVWLMATAGGATSLQAPAWRWEGWGRPFLLLHLPGMTHIEDVIAHATPEHVEWMNPAAESMH